MKKSSTALSKNYNAQNMIEFFDENGFIPPRVGIFCARGESGWQERLRFSSVWAEVL